MKIDGVILKNLNHKINRKAMLQAEIEREMKRAEDGFAGAWNTVNLLWEAFDETLHAVAGYDDCLPGDEVSRYPSITGAMWQWDTDKVSPCLTHWREKMGLIETDIRENSEKKIIISKKFKNCFISCLPSRIQAEIKRAVLEALKTAKSAGIGKAEIKELTAEAMASRVADAENLIQIKYF